MLRTVFLELTNNCNMNCDFCPNALMTRPRGFMPAALARKIIDQLQEMGFSGSLITSLMGEPLMHTDFLSVVKYSSGLGIATNVITNMALIPGKISLPQLLNSGINRLCLSFQTPDEKLFRLRRSGLRFSEYYGRLMKAVSYFANNSVNTKHLEIHLLQSIYNTLNTEIVTDYAVIQTLIDSLIETIYCAPERKELLNQAKQKAYDYLTRFKRGKQFMDAFDIPLSPLISLVIKRANTWVNSLLPDGCSVRPSARGQCDFFNYSIGIFWDGRVTVCCQDFDGRIIIGDAGREPLQAILNGPKIEELRRMNRKGILAHELCQVCRGIIVKNGRPFSLIKPQTPINRFYNLAARLKAKLSSVMRIS